MNYLIFGKYKINNRIYKNLKGLLLEFFSRTTIQIFFFPLMFYIWGTEYTGIWIFLTSITTFAALTNLNPDEFIRQHMILNFDNKIEKQKIYSNGFIIALINSLFFFLVVYFVNLIFLDKFTITENINFKDLKTFIFIIAFGSALSIISNYFLIKFEIEGKIFLKVNLINLFFILNRVVPLLVGLYSKDFNNIFYAYIGLQIIQLIIFLYWSKKVKIFFNYSDVSIGYLKKIIKNSLRYYLINLKGLLSVSGLNYIIGFFFNAEIISIYNAINVMFKWFYVRIIGMVHTITTYEIARFSKIIKKIKILNKRIDISAYVFGSILIIISFTFGKLIFNEWTLYRFENFNNLKVLIYLITIEAIFYVLCSNELIYLKAINKIRIVAEINIILESVSLIIIFISLLKFQNIMIVIQIQIIKNLILLFINKIYKNKQLNLTHN
ncbi:hypothetical protein OAN92_02900 [Candidatus Pelagibacter ubique]|nr:hypothetical protein [Candidatus Pelagibacter ubique]